MTIKPTYSPWGRPDRVCSVRSGIWWIETPSHGGIAVDMFLAKFLSPICESLGEWHCEFLFFEEDCAWAYVAYELRLYSDLERIWRPELPPELLSKEAQETREAALRVIRDYHPELLAQAVRPA